MAERNDNLTIEQYLALTRGNQAPGMVKPEIGGIVNFEIKSQFMRELREHTFFKNTNDDAHEHVERVLDIVSLFNIPGVSHDVVMFVHAGAIFPYYFTGRDMKKLKENVHAIQVGCQTCEGAHLDKDCPLNEEVKGMEEVKYGEFSRPFPNNRYDSIFNKGGYDQPSSGEKRPSLTKIINKSWRKHLRDKPSKMNG
ncbi:hypothetical protein Tco_1163490 [Tanacetum coccineum]